MPARRVLVDSLLSAYRRQYASAVNLPVALRAGIVAGPPSMTYSYFLPAMPYASAVAIPAFTIGERRVSFVVTGLACSLFR